VKLWDPNEGKLLKTLRGEHNMVSVAITSDGRRVVAGSHDNTIGVWDPGTGKRLTTLIGHSATPYSIAASPNKSVVASGGGDGSVRLWNIESGAELARFEHVGSVWSVAFSPDGSMLASGGFDRNVKIWDTAKYVLKMSR
jgi:WD40 repeat protein